MSAITDNPLTAEDRRLGGTNWFAFADSTQKFWCCFWASVALACLPFLVPYFRTLWRQELYQYFPFLLVSVGYLFYARWDRVWRGPDSRPALVVPSIGAAVLVIAAAMHSTWLGAVGFVLLAVSFLASHRSLSGASLAYLALPLVMLIRMPQLHTHSLVVRLQKVTTALTALILDVLRVPHDTYANAIHLPTKDLFVAEACSGIQSAFTMCFLALLIIVWRRRPLMVTPLYLAAALVLAILANTVRVTMIALAEAWFTLDMTSGWVHDAVGYFSLAIAAAILLSFDCFANMLFHPVEIQISKRGANPIGVAWNYLLGFKTRDYGDAASYWSVTSDPASADGDRAVRDFDGDVHRSSRTRWPASLAGITVLAALVMITGFLIGRTDRRAIVSKDAVLFEPPKDLLDGRFGVLTVGAHEVVRNGTDPQLGLHADIWNCATGDVNGQVVMSQPYVGWHELCVCYEVQDWELIERYNKPVAGGQPVAVGEFENQAGLKGYLIFTAVDSDGSVPSPPSYTLFGRLLAPFGPLVTDDFAETSGSAQTIMLQLWTVTEETLTPEEIGELAQSVATIRQQARDGIIQHQQSLLAKK